MQNIENELKERLKKGVYGDIYNIDFKKFEDILEMERDEEVAEEQGEVSSIPRIDKPTLFMFIECSWVLIFGVPLIK